MQLTFYKNILRVLSSRLLLKGINFAVLFFLLQTMSPSQIGQYGVFISALFLATTFGNLGVKHSSAREIGQGTNLNLIQSSVLVSYPLLAIVSFISFWLALFLSGFKIQSLYDYALIVISVSAHLVIILRQGVCLGEGDFNFYNILEVLPRLILLIIVVLFSFITIDRFTTNLGVFGLTIGLVLTAIYAYIKTNIHIINKNKKQIINLIKQGIWYSLALTLIILNFQLPLFVTSSISGESEAGLVFTALRINDIILELATATALVLFSNSTRIQTESKIEWINLSIVIVILVTSAVGLFVYFFSDLILLYFAGKEYLEAINYLNILLIGLPFAAYNKLAYGKISGMGKPRTGLIVYILALSANIIIALLLFNFQVKLFLIISLVLSQIIASVIFIYVIRFNYISKF